MEAVAHSTPRRRSERGSLARGRRWGELWQRRRTLLQQQEQQQEQQREQQQQEQAGH